MSSGEKVGSSAQRAGAAWKAAVPQRRLAPAWAIIHSVEFAQDSPRRRAFGPSPLRALDAPFSLRSRVSTSWPKRSAGHQARFQPPVDLTEGAEETYAETTR